MLALLVGIEAALDDRPALAQARDLVEHRPALEHRPEEVRVKRVQPPPIGRLSGGRRDGLPDQEAAEDGPSRHDRHLPDPALPVAPHAQRGNRIGNLSVPLIADLFDHRVILSGGYGGLDALPTNGGDEDLLRHDAVLTGPRPWSRMPAARGRQSGTPRG